LVVVGDEATLQTVNRVAQEEKLKPSDTMVPGEQPTTLITAYTLRDLAGTRVGSETDYLKEKALLERLRRLKPEELAQAIPRSGVRDSLLSALVEQKTVAERKLATLKQEHKDDVEAGKLANQVADLNGKIERRVAGIADGLEAEVDRLRKGLTASTNQQADTSPPRSAAPVPIPQPEIQTTDNAFSTFSLNVSDVSFKLAAASLEKGVMPEPASVRSEEFINAFDYRDPEPTPGAPVGFAWERARYPYAQNRDLLRFSIKTAARGREAGRPLNLVLLLDNSGSMERADRVRIIHEALRVLAAQLQAQDTFSVVTFARTARLWVDGVPGSQAGQVAEEVSGLTPQGGTNLEEAMNLAYQTALRHYLANGINRVVLLTDGAANLGNVDPEALKQKVDAQRKQGIALDCFGIGWEGYNDDLLEVLTRNGNGRYGFVNTPEEAASEFAGQLAGALRVAASDVKAQVEFSPARVAAYRQIGYAKHQLTKEQFRDNTVAAAEIGAAEAGNALYVVEVNPAGEGPLGTVRVRYRVPGTSDYREHEWTVPYTGNAASLEQASAAMRLAGTVSAFSEWLAISPFAAEVTPDSLLGCLRGVPEVYGADVRPKKLEWMIRQAKSVAGK
jgi:secreted protein with Ig-like and vWFA domain